MRYDGQDGADDGDRDVTQSDSPENHHGNDGDGEGRKHSNRVNDAQVVRVPAKVGVGEEQRLHAEMWGRRGRRRRRKSRRRRRRRRKKKREIE